MKSIYEEALEKIVVEFSSWDIAEHLELFKLVEHALEQAQKQEELLELYRKLMTVKDEATSIVWFDAEMEAEVIDLEIQIEELENERKNN